MLGGRTARRPGASEDGGPAPDLHPDGRAMVAGPTGRGSRKRMTDAERRYYLTTAIDYPNSRPHIGTAFEKIGADVQARFRRMEGAAVHFLMGNDENTIKVPQRARDLNLEPKAYVDEMARQFQEV